MGWGCGKAEVGVGFLATARAANGREWKKGRTRIDNEEESKEVQRMRRQRTERRKEVSVIPEKIIMIMN